MSSWDNLKDAGRLVPGWVAPFTLSAGVIGLYALARYTSPDQPHALIAFGSLVAIVCSILVGFGLLVSAIARARPGHVLAAVGDGFQQGLTYVWVTAAVSLFAYVGAPPAYRLITANLYYSLTAAVVALLLATGYWASGLRQKPEPLTDSLTGLPSTELALPPGFMPTREQKAAFQVTMADQTRLMIHQAARLIAYQGSNCLVADSFSALLDLNARTAKIFTDMNLLSTADMLFWRMHMLLIGSAAESVIRNTNSDAAMDDLQNFEELAVKYLLLTNKGNFYRPVTDAEAMLKSNRIHLLHRSVMSRCVAAVQQNRHLILELIKLMRVRPTLVYEDLRHVMSRVELPADFPRAEFDSNEVMEQALVQIGFEGSEIDDGVQPQSLPAAGDHSRTSDTTPQASVESSTNVFPFGNSSFRA